MTNRRYKRYTDDEIEYIRSQSKTKSIDQVCKELGRSKRSMYGYAKRHKIHFVHGSIGKERLQYNTKIDNPNPITDITESLICKCIIDGMTYSRLYLLTGRNPDIAKEIINKCKANGKYDAIKKGIYLSNYFGDDKDEV